jgi:hypothetical protein
MTHSRSIEWEETTKADTGLLGLSTKHIHSTNPRKRFRVRYDRTVSFEPQPYEGGSGITRDAPTEKPQSFVNGGSWLVYKLVINLAQL